MLFWGMDMETVISKTIVRDRYQHDHSTWLVPLPRYALKFSNYDYYQFVPAACVGVPLYFMKAMHIGSWTAFASRSACLLCHVMACTEPVGVPRPSRNHTKVNRAVPASTPLKSLRYCNSVWQVTSPWLCCIRPPEAILPS